MLLTKTKEVNRATWILLAALLLIFVPFLGDTLFNTKGEPREAIVAVSMLQTGNWILPVSCGTDIPYKPPFLAWMIALFSLIGGGEVTEFTSRLPSVLGMIAMTVALFRFVGHRLGLLRAWLTAAITVTTVEMFRASTVCRVDMLVTAFIVMSLIALYRHHEKGDFGISLPAILLMTCGVLVKGPIGALIPVMVYWVFCMIHYDGWLVLTYKTVITVAFSLILPAFWYISAYQLGGNAFLELALEENVGRFMGKMSYEAHENPFWYNFVTVIAGNVPYTLLALLTLFVVPWRKLKKMPPVKGLLKRLRHMQPVGLYSMLAILLIFVFYCIPKSKRSVYLLPIYPFIAYFLAIMIEWLIDRHRGIMRTYGIIISAICLLPLVALFLLRFVGLGNGFSLHGSNGLLLSGIMESHMSWPGILVAAVAWIVALQSLVLWISLPPQAYKRIDDEEPRRAAWRAVAMTLGATAALYWSLLACYLPAMMEAKSDRDIATRILTRIPDSGYIYSYIPDQPMLRQYTINFYIGDRARPIEHFPLQEGEEALVIVGENDLPRFESYAAERDYSILSSTATGHRGCDLKQQLVLLNVLGPKAEDAAQAPNE